MAHKKEHVGKKASRRGKAKVHSALKIVGGKTMEKKSGK